MEEVALVDIKAFRHSLADKLEAWGKKHGMYATIPMVPTIRIKHELIRTPLFSNKEKHIRRIVRKFTPTQPASMNIILIEIRQDYPIEYTIALSEYEAILNEQFQKPAE